MRVHLHLTVHGTIGFLEHLTESEHQTKHKAYNDIRQSRSDLFPIAFFASFVYTYKGSFSGTGTVDKSGSNTNPPEEDSLS